jgi:hypothetical protein
VAGLRFGGSTPARKINFNFFINRNLGALISILVTIRNIRGRVFQP